MYKLYKITNNVNQKLYIGITKLSLQDRWDIHCFQSKHPKYPVQRAIRKYNRENFKIELLEESPDRNYISNLEEPTILKCNSRQYGYNVAKGGYGGDLGPAANEKRRQTILTRSKVEKQRLATMQLLRQSGKTKYNDKGRASQAIKMLGNQHRQGILHSKEDKEKISKALAGKPKSEITKTRMSTSAKLNNNGKRFTGRRACCLCCNREWDIGNYTQHIRRQKYK